MLLKIHNLPSDTSYADVKALILAQCGLSNVILDNLIPEGTGKIVTVGVADEDDASNISGKLHGLYIHGHQLYVNNVQQKKAAAKPNQTPAPAIPPLIPKSYANPPQMYNTTLITSPPVPPPQPKEGHVPMLSQNSSMGLQYTANQGGVPFFMSSQNTFPGYGMPTQQPQQSSYSAPYNSGYPLQNTQNMSNYYTMNDYSNTQYQSNTNMPPSSDMASSQYDYNNTVQGGTNADYASWYNDRRGNEPTRRQPPEQSASYSGNRFNEEQRQDSNSSKKSRWGDPNGRQNKSKDRQFESRSNDNRGHGSNPGRGPADFDRNMAHSGVRNVSSNLNRGGSNAKGTNLDSGLGEYGARDVNPPSNYNLDDFHARDVNHASNYNLGVSNARDSYPASNFGGGGFYPSDANPAEFRSDGFNPHTNLSSGFGSEGFNAGDASLNDGSQRSRKHGGKNKSQQRNSNQYTTNNFHQKPQAGASNRSFANAPNRGGTNDPSRSRTNAPNRGATYYYASNIPGATATNRGDANAPYRGDSNTSYRSGANAPYRGGASAPKRSAPEPWRNEQEMPGSKRARPPIDVKFFKFNKLYDKPKTNMKKIFVSDDQKRDLVSNFITSEIVKTSSNPQIGAEKPLQLLNRCIRARIEIALGYYINIEPPEITAVYRALFPVKDDEKLCEAIVNRAMNENPEEEKETLMSSYLEERTKSIDASKDGFVDKAGSSTTQGLPSYPTGNKRDFKVVKRQLALEQLTSFEDMFKNSNISPSAVEEEVAGIIDAVKQVFANPKTDIEKIACERILQNTKDQAASDGTSSVKQKKKSPLDILEETLKLQIAKRVLKIGLTPAVRITGPIKCPKKQSLASFLLGKGVVSLKKSERKPLFIAHMDSYANLDKLLAMKNVMIDGLPIKFRPMHVTENPKLPKSLRVLKAPLPTNLIQNINKSRNQDVVFKKPQVSEPPGTSINQVPVPKPDFAIPKQPQPSKKKNKNKKGPNPQIATKAQPNAITPANVNKQGNVAKPQTSVGNIQANTKPQANAAKSQASVANTQSNGAKPQTNVSNTQSNVVKSQASASNTQPEPATPQTNVTNTQTNAAKSQVSENNTQPTAAKSQASVANTQPNATTPQTDVANNQSNAATPQTNVANNQSNAGTPQTDVANNQSNAANLQTSVANTQPKAATPQTSVANTPTNAAKTPTDVANTKPQTNVANSQANQSPAKSNTNAQTSSNTPISQNAPTPTNVGSDTVLKELTVQIERLPNTEGNNKNTVSETNEDADELVDDVDDVDDDDLEDY